MSIIPCEQSASLKAQIDAFAETLKTQAHLLEGHGLSEAEFYDSGLFRGAIERIRGQFSSSLRAKREFVQHVLNHLQDLNLIHEWELAEAEERSDYQLQLPSGKNAVISLTGAMDGNNTNIFERPDSADEFIIWSVSTNRGGDPRKNAWSGIHSRLTAEMISNHKQVDGLLVWDLVCATAERICPKLVACGDDSRLTSVGPFRLPPPCIYVFPRSLPPETGSVDAQSLSDVELLNAFYTGFGGREDEVNYVSIALDIRNGAVRRQTTVTRSGLVQKRSRMASIRRVRR